MLSVSQTFIFEICKKKQFTNASKLKLVSPAESSDSDDVYNINMPRIKGLLACGDQKTELSQDFQVDVENCVALA